MVAAGTMMSQPARAAGGETHSFHSPALEMDAPSMAAGLGSLDVVELHHQLQSGAAGVKASPSLFFDVPTVRSMRAVIVAAAGMSPVPLTSFASSKSLELPVRCPRPPALSPSRLSAAAPPGPRAPAPRLSPVTMRARRRSASAPRRHCA